MEELIKQSEPRLSIKVSKDFLMEVKKRAATRGISMRRYVLAAVMKQIEKDMISEK